MSIQKRIIIEAIILIVIVSILVWFLKPHYFFIAFVAIIAAWVLFHKKDLNI